MLLAYGADPREKPTSAARLAKSTAALAESALEAAERVHGPASSVAALLRAVAATPAAPTEVRQLVSLLRWTEVIKLLMLPLI